MWNLPLVPFEFALFAMLFCYAAGLLSGFAIFLFAYRLRGKNEPAQTTHAASRRPY